MTFAAPWVLVALVGVPVLLAVYVGRVRPQRSGAGAFALPHMLPSVLPRPPRWRRHLPVLALLLAAAALVGAAARPQRSVAVTVPQASVMLLTDVSGSMKATDVAPNRLTAAQRAARTFLGSVPKRVKVGIMAFNQTPTLLQSPTADRQAAKDAIGQLTVSGTTATGDAIKAALKDLRSSTTSVSGAKSRAAIVVLSDGKSTRGSDPVAAARLAGQAKVPVYTVALGTSSGTITVTGKKGATRKISVPPDPTTLAAIAKASGGKSFTVADASRLESVYQGLGSTLSHATRNQQLTAWFAGAGLLLLLVSAAMSLRWFGRLA